MLVSKAGATLSPSSRLWGALRLQPHHFAPRGARARSAANVSVGTHLLSSQHRPSPGLPHTTVSASSASTPRGDNCTPAASRELLRATHHRSSSRGALAHGHILHTSSAAPARPACAASTQPAGPTEDSPETLSPAPAKASAEPGNGSAGSASSAGEVQRQEQEQERLELLSARLSALREEMARANVDAFIIPAEDAHQCEYRAPCFERMSFISGFTGSAGTCVVTVNQALLWTDGRYFLQARQQLPKEWDLMRAGIPGIPTVAEWLASTLPAGSRVGIDPFLHTAESEVQLRESLETKGSLLVHLQGNPIDAVWGPQRPSEPLGELWVHPLEFAGVSVREKVAAMQEEMRHAGASLLVTSLLDEVAWLLNVRGRDVPHCPVAISYAAVAQDGAHLFIDKRKLSPAVMQHLEEAAVHVHAYDKLLPFIARAVHEGQTLWMDPSKASAALFAAFYSAFPPDQGSGEGDALGAPAEKKRKKAAGAAKGKKVKGRGKGAKDKHAKAAGNEAEGEEEGGAAPGPGLVTLPCPITLAKACKNKAEIEGMQRAHLRDAAALAEFWAWLEEEVQGKGRQVSEMEAIDELEGFRAKQEGFLETSFDTIAGANSNGAIIHYKAEAATAGTIDGSTLLLLDSGGQYADGTTDVTRTAHLGTPTAYQKEAFTCVLQGHIALDRAVFPAGTPGFVLDVLARKDLWRIGLDYRHGTGHGVGACLNVHEGPQGISPRFGNATPLQPGMVLSNEPGFYHDGSFGIRIENLMVVREEPTEHRFGGTTFFGFDRLTLVPIQARLIDLSLMAPEEIDWVDSYHAQVWEQVSPLLSGRALQWLLDNTRPLKMQHEALSGAGVEALASELESVPS